MSYKDVRDLFEYLRILGYPKHLKVSTLYTTEGSLENFELVFDILRWLIDQYEPGTIILGSSETEAERILLAKSCVEFFIVKTGIKLSALRLYAASSASARQLLKVVELIMQRPVDVLEQRDKQNFNTMSRIDDSINVRHRSKDLSTELMHLGASLFELLGKEKDNQEKRNIQTGRQLEQSNTDKLMTGVITGANLKLSRDRERLKTVLTEKQAISAKVDRKKADLERLKQRLDTLQKIRPAFSEEFDRAEEELQKLYSIYFKYVRCLDVLRAQSNSGANNSPAIFESTKNGSASQSMVTLPEGILDLSEDLSNDEDETGDDILDSNPEDLKASAKNVDEEEKIAEKAKLRIKTGVGKNADNRFHGNMLEAGDSDLESSLEIDNEDSDSDLDDIDNVEALYNFSENTGSRKSAKPKVTAKDEDF